MIKTLEHDDVPQQSEQPTCRLSVCLSVCLSVSFCITLDQAGQRDIHPSPSHTVGCLKADEVLSQSLRGAQIQNLLLPPSPVLSTCLRFLSAPLYSTACLKFQTGLIPQLPASQSLHLPTVSFFPLAIYPLIGVVLSLSCLYICRHRAVQEKHSPNGPKQKKSKGENKIASWRTNTPVWIEWQMDRQVHWLSQTASARLLYLICIRRSTQCVRGVLTCSSFTSLSFITPTLVEFSSLFLSKQFEAKQTGHKSFLETFASSRSTRRVCSKFDYPSI